MSDEAFERMADLLDKLPAMQDKGAALARARWADRIATLADEHETCESLLESADERLRQAEELLARAEDSDGATFDDARRAVLHAAALRGFRIAPQRNAERALRDALGASPFDAVADARAARMRPEERKALEAEVTAYQRDYARTLEECERRERALSASVRSTDR